MANFFDEKSVLQVDCIKSTVQTMQEDASYLDILTRACGAEKFQIIALSVHAAVLGKYELGEVIFPLGKPKDKYLLELRAFNATKEVYIRKQGKKYSVRTIVDGVGEMVEVVDAVSNLFGDKVKATDVPTGFVKLVEAGRKISMVVPADDTSAEHYALKTRSYIVYDKDTCQAGYGYYRYVDIEVAAKE